MIVLAEKEGRIFAAETIQRPGDFTCPFPEALFPCLIWDHASGFSDEERSMVARALIDNGCRYAVCAGECCEAWHDTVDAQLLRQDITDPAGDVEAPFVMTTWHEGEGPDEVAFFFVVNTNFEDHDFQRYLVLHVGSSDVTATLNAAVRKYALNEDAV